MPRIPGTTNAQSLFIRAFYKNPSGPPPEQWPSAVILARWRRRPAFQTAWKNICDALDLQAALRLDTATSRAADTLHQSFLSDGPDPDPIKNQNSKIKNALHLLHHAHVRSRFPTR